MPSATVKHQIVERINWPQFMARHDLTWESLPQRWHEGAFIGNGALGAMIYNTAQGELRFDLNSSNITDRGHRLPVGELYLKPQGTVKSGTMRLDLWNAEATGSITTDKGEIKWRAFTHAQSQLMVVELKTSPGEAGCTLTFHPERADDPRRVYQKEPIPANELNPDPVLGKDDEVSYCTQALNSNGQGMSDYTTVWREVTLEANHRLLYLSIGASQSLAAPGAPSGRYWATGIVNSAATTPLDDSITTHRDWWHKFYPASFISISDTRLESFYWIQMYKLGSATRATGLPIDLMGPWFRTTPWAAIWWNLNIQLTYWPVYASNHLELGESLTNALDRGLPNLIHNAPEQYRNDSAAIGRVSSYDLRGGAWKEIGNLTWACHNYWLQYRYSMDDAMLRERLFPLLRRSVNYYLHLLQSGADGKLHLPVAISPEYPEEAADTNYDLSLLRWGCTALISTCERLKINDPLLPRWKDTLVRLTPYPVDEKTGLMIGRDVPLAQSHRHFSHLLMIYPLHLMNWEQPEHQDLITKSLDHWIGFKGALQGYSYTGAAAISADIGRRDAAVSLLNQFLDSYVKPNTMYLEAGPVIETPLAGAASLQEILLQSWGNKIRIFPGVPDSWRDVTIHNMRAEGAFLVSAVRRSGNTKWVSITSLANEPCRVQADFSGPWQAGGSRAFKVQMLSQNVAQLDLHKGETVLLYPRGTHPGFTIAPVAAQPERVNFYGSRKQTMAQSPDGSFTLPAAKAFINGDDLFYEKTEIKDDLGHWVNAHDWASWRLNFQQPGRFRVLMSYGVPTGTDGGTYAVSIGDETLKGKVQPTGDWYKYQEFEVGTVSIPKAGKVEVSVKVVDKPKVALMNLHSIRLVNAGH
ncbi:MAG: hypothetical protein JO316_08285 [Abitibacteriaceae bacterium]|nr:hypothetical protein [Abditibacteriaceae bacterium]